MTSTKIAVGFDTETDLITQQKLAPRMICASLATPPAAPGESYGTFLTVNHDWTDLRALIETLLTNHNIIKVGQSIGYDLTVIASNIPEFLPLIFDALANEAVSDVAIREKLLTLATTGDLEFIEMPDGSKTRARWNLETFVKKYFGRDISADKKDADAWRLNYRTLDNVPVAEWPEKAVSYAKGDALDALMIRQLQEETAKQVQADRGIDVFKTESFRVYLDFCLRLMSAWGAATDEAAVLKVEADVNHELRPENLNLLRETGILREAVAGTPKKGKAHVEGCPLREEHLTGLIKCPDCNGTGIIHKRPEEEGQGEVCPRCADPGGGHGYIKISDFGECTCPQATTKGTPETKNIKALHSYVVALAAKLNRGECPTCGGTGKNEPALIPEGIEPLPNTVTMSECPICKGNGCYKQPPVIKLRRTAPSDRFPKTEANPEGGQLSVDAEFLDDYAHLDPVLSQYKHRQDLQGIVTRELPRMKLNGKVAPVVHPQYDCLKSTGRTSSFSADSKDYASFNCQNVDPRVRQCFVPRPGYLWFSLDFSQMELGTVAQKCYSLFGHSVLRDKINAGVDIHAYTGAQLAFAMDKGFAGYCSQQGAANRDDIFNLFLPMKSSPDDTMKKFYLHWRKFAKPVNLGYPGGLGARTFVKLAKVAYDVQVTEETAGIFRDLWKETYPEFVEYFNYVNKNCIDPHNKGRDLEDGTEYNKYFYVSPDGMYRAGCDYCACANGMGLQTPSAEGALSALVQIVTLCYNWKMNSIIGPDQHGMTVHPIFFIHDEICGEIREDNQEHERMMEMKRIMVESMRRITPDVAVNANPAIMRRWDKAAEAVYDAEGRLAVWVPK